MAGIASRKGEGGGGQAAEAEGHGRRRWSSAARDAGQDGDELGEADQQRLQRAAAPPCGRCCRRVRHSAKPSMAAVTRKQTPIALG